MKTDVELDQLGDEAPTLMSKRFRGFLPVVIDIETGGFNSETDAILEIAATFLQFDENAQLSPLETLEFAIEPFGGANIEPAALEFTGIDPYSDSRDAKDEAESLRSLTRSVRQEVRQQGCVRAVLVGHNASFDHGFLFAALQRHNIKRNPFHPFSTLDTVSLSALAFGQTVLANACKAARIEFSNSSAHRASYDCIKTAELFCTIVNRWQNAMGWPGQEPPAPV